MFENIKPGDEVWVVERDEGGNVADVVGFLFLAEVADAVIVTLRVYGCDGIKEILEYHIQQTVEDFDTDLSVYPAKDCYQSRLDARKAMFEERGEDDG
jgi:hypothetical protein